MEKAGMINRYVCQECGESIITINADDGTTPFMIRCRATEGCGGVMQSSFYMVSQKMTPQFEWFMPPIKDLKKYSRATREHIKKGGLVLRARERE